MARVEAAFKSSLWVNVLPIRLRNVTSVTSTRTELKGKLDFNFFIFKAYISELLMGPSGGQTLSCEPLKVPSV